MLIRDLEPLEELVDDVDDDVVVVQDGPKKYTKAHTYKF